MLNDGLMMLLEVPKEKSEDHEEVGYGSIVASSNDVKRIVAA